MVKMGKVVVTGSEKAIWRQKNLDNQGASRDCVISCQILFVYFISIKEFKEAAIEFSHPCTYPANFNWWLL